MKSLQIGQYIDLAPSNLSIVLEKGLHDGTLELAREICISKGFSYIEQIPKKTNEQFDKFVEDNKIQWFFNKIPTTENNYTCEYLFFGEHYYIQIKILPDDVLKKQT